MHTLCLYPPFTVSKLDTLNLCIQQLHESLTNKLADQLTVCIITKLSANYMSINFLGASVSDGTPYSIEVYLYPALPAIESSHQTNISILVVGTYRTSIKY